MPPPPPQPPPKLDRRKDVEEPRLVESLPQVVVEKEAIQVGKITTGEKRSTLQLNGGSIQNIPVDAFPLEKDKKVFFSKMEMKTSGPLSGPPFGPIFFFKGDRQLPPTQMSTFFFKAGPPRREKKRSYHRMGKKGGPK